MMTAPQAPVKTMIRLLDDHAIVPSSTGRGCYHVSFEDGVSVHCTCPDHARRSRVCKHMDAVDRALRGEAEKGKGRDTYHVELAPKAAPKRSALDGARAEVELVPQSRKPARQTAPTLAALYSTKPAPTWTDAQKRALAAHFEDFEAAVW